MNSELSQLRVSEPCDECGVDTVKLLDERDKLTEVVKACEMALVHAQHHNHEPDCAETPIDRGPQIDICDLCKVTQSALALIHTLQSGDKKEGSK